jgi:acyl-CoA ligase (AMP-forming) (exosortase A-associated)
MMQTQLHNLIGEQVCHRADRRALTADGTSLTYAQLWIETVELAAGLRSLGVERGERVGIYLEKRIEAVVAPFATSAAGGAFVPVNPLLRAHQVRHILADCDARVLVTSPERLTLLAEALDGLDSLEHVIVVGGSAEPPPGVRCEVHDWDALRADEVVDPGRIDVDVAAILYTSGSTGNPKGVVLSHRNLLAGAHSVSQYLSNHEGDRLLAVLPLSFDAGFSQVTTAFAVGAEVVLINYLLPRDVVRRCSEHAITGLTCVPPLWNQLVECEWDERARNSMRYFASTGGRMPRATLDRLREIFPRAKPYLMYGLTEAFRSTYLDPAQVDARPDSIGKAIPNAEILVVRDDGSECDPGEPGELVHRGALVAMGYWNDPDRTAARFKPVPGAGPAAGTGERAVFSGDLVQRDSEGFLYFVGRKDEMIKTSGYRVSPTEIEQVAHGTGLIGDAVALGIDDDRIGQRIVLVASPANGHLEPEELLGVLRRELPLYMVPERIVVRPSLPRSPNSKLDRNLIREELTEA